jgi:hypothetical protein
MEDHVRPLRLVSFAFLTLAVAVPMLGAIAADVTVPIVGFVQGPNDVSYRTELTITNYRDVPQYVELSLIKDGYAQPRAIFQLEPYETEFLPSAGFGTSSSAPDNIVGALRIRALEPFHSGDLEGTADPNGRIEATAFVVADRGRFAKHGSSRQEVAGIPSSDYIAEEAVFLGVRHSINTGVYTNVGIVNMHPTQTATFYVQFQYADPIAVVVPPNTLRQIRLPGEGHGGRYVRVYPEWSIGDGPPARTMPWVAYTSSVDMLTGDAFSGLRVPASSRYDFPDLP